MLHGTRVYYAQVSHNFFLIAQFPPQQYHDGKTSRNSSLRHKKVVFSYIVLKQFFLQKNSEIGDIRPFLPITLNKIKKKEKICTGGPHVKKHQI